MYLVKTKRGIRAIEAKPANFNDLIEQAKNRFADEGFICEDQIEAESIIAPLILHKVQPYQWYEIKNYAFTKELTGSAGAFVLSRLKKVEEKGPSPLQDLLEDLKKMGTKLPKGSPVFSNDEVNHMFDSLRYAMTRPLGFVTVDHGKFGFKWEPIAEPKIEHVVDFKYTPREAQIKEMFKMQEHTVLKPGQAAIKDEYGVLHIADKYRLKEIRFSPRYKGQEVLLEAFGLSKVDSKPLEQQYNDKLRKSHIDFAKFYTKQDDSDYYLAYKNWIAGK